MICGFARDPAWPSGRRRRQVQPVPLVHAAKSAPTFFDEAIRVRSNGPLVSTSEPFLICAFFSMFCPCRYFNSDVSHMFLGGAVSPSQNGRGAGEWGPKSNDRRLVRHVTFEEPPSDRTKGKLVRWHGACSSSGASTTATLFSALEERWNRGTAQPNEIRTLSSYPSPSSYSNFANFVNWCGRQKQ
jgi:hypothetical protein